MGAKETNPKKPKPCRAFLKGSENQRILSFSILLWPNGGATLELGELGDFDYWRCLEKFYTTTGKVYDFWVYLGKALAKHGVSAEAISQTILEGIPAEA